MSKAGNIGGGAGNAVTFSNVTVPADGVYWLEVDYANSGLHSFFLTINDVTANELDLNGTTLDLNGTTFDEPVAALYSVRLHAGVNTLRFDM